MLVLMMQAWREKLGCEKGGGCGCGWKILIVLFFSARCALLASPGVLVLPCHPASPEVKPVCVAPPHLSHPASP